MYGCSAKLDTEKHGYSGFARIIPVAEVAQLIRIYPPDSPHSRSILGLQKNGTDAETCAEISAEPYAEKCADAERFADALCRAERLADVGAETVAAPEGRPVYRGCRANLTCSSSGATCREVEWVAPLELKRRAELRAVSRADDYAEPCADVRAVIGAEIRCSKM